MSGLQMESVISKGLGQESANTKANYSGAFYWDRMLQHFRLRLKFKKRLHKFGETVKFFKILIKFC